MERRKKVNKDTIIIKSTCLLIQTALLIVLAYKVIITRELITCSSETLVCWMAVSISVQVALFAIILWMERIEDRRTSHETK